MQQIWEPRRIYEHPANRFVADFIGETNFVEGRVQEVKALATVAIPGATVMASSEGHVLAEGQLVTLAIRPEKINVYPVGKVDLMKKETGIDVEAAASLFGDKIPSGEVDVREYLAMEKNSVVVRGRVQEAIYIGTDCRYKVGLGLGVTALVVRVQNFGSRYDTMFSVGDDVYVHWAAENAQILLD